MRQHAHSPLLSSPLPPTTSLSFLERGREREREKGIPKKSKYGVISKNAIVVVCCKERKILGLLGS
jgi:hypothetical protein